MLSSTARISNPRRIGAIADRALRRFPTGTDRKRAGPRPRPAPRLRIDQSGLIGQGLEPARPGANETRPGGRDVTGAHALASIPGRPWATPRPAPGSGSPGAALGRHRGWDGPARPPATMHTIPMTVSPAARAGGRPETPAVGPGPPDAKPGPASLRAGRRLADHCCLGSPGELGRRGAGRRRPHLLGPPPPGREFSAAVWLGVTSGPGTGRSDRLSGRPRGVGTAYTVCSSEVSPVAPTRSVVSSVRSFRTHHGRACAARR